MEMDKESWILIDRPVVLSGAHFGKSYFITGKGKLTFVDAWVENCIFKLDGPAFVDYMQAVKELRISDPTLPVVFGMNATAIEMKIVRAFRVNEPGWYNEELEVKES